MQDKILESFIRIYRLDPSDKNARVLANHISRSSNIDSKSIKDTLDDLNLIETELHRLYFVKNVQNILKKVERIESVELVCGHDDNYLLYKSYLSNDVLRSIWQFYKDIGGKYIELIDMSSGYLLDYDYDQLKKTGLKIVDHINIDIATIKTHISQLHDLYYIEQKLGNPLRININRKNHSIEKLIRYE